MQKKKEPHDKLDLMLNDIKASTERLNRNLPHLNEMTTNQVRQVEEFEKTVQQKLRVYALSCIIANLCYTQQDLCESMRELDKCREEAVKVGLSSDWKSLANVIDTGRGQFVHQVLSRH